MVWKVTDVDVVKLLVNIELSDKFFSRKIEFKKVRKIHFDWLTPKHLVGKVFDVFLKLLVIYYPMIIWLHACRDKNERAAVHTKC